MTVRSWQEEKWTILTFKSQYLSPAQEQRPLISLTQDKLNLFEWGVDMRGGDDEFCFSISRGRDRMWRSSPVQEQVSVLLSSVHSSTLWSRESRWWVHNLKLISLFQNQRHRLETWTAVCSSDDEWVLIKSDFKFEGKTKSCILNKN